MTDLSKLRILQDHEVAQLAIDNPGVKWNPEKWCPTCRRADVDKLGNAFYRNGGQRVLCDCAEQMMLFKHYMLAGIGKTYHRLSWRDFVRSKAVADEVSSYVENHVEFVDRGVGIIFIGPIGSGKTMLANLALKELIKLGYKCHATSAEETTSNMTATWRSTDDKRRFEDVYVRSEVLLLDDFGRGLINDRTGVVKEEHKFKEGIIDTILRKRVQYGRPTLFTTNLSTNKLLEGYGPAVHSLIAERSIPLEVKGRDFRPEVLDLEIDEAARGERKPIV